MLCLAYSWGSFKVIVILVTVIEETIRHGIVRPRCTELVERNLYLKNKPFFSLKGGNVK